jgi:hypothetical protein
VLSKMGRLEDAVLDYSQVKPTKNHGIQIILVQAEKVLKSWSGAAPVSIDLLRASINSRFRASVYVDIQYIDIDLLRANLAPVPRIKGGVAVHNTAPCSSPVLFFIPLSYS